MLPIENHAQNIGHPAGTGIGNPCTDAQEDGDCRLQHKPEAARSGQAFGQVCEKLPESR